MLIFFTGIFGMLFDTKIPFIGKFNLKESNNQLNCACFLRIEECIYSHFVILALLFCIWYELQQNNGEWFTLFRIMGFLMGSESSSVGEK